MGIITRRSFLRSLGAVSLLGFSLPWGLGARARGRALPNLRFSLPPMISSFPIAFAQDQGIFADHGIRIEEVGFSKLTDRNVSLLTGQLDGALSDIASILLLVSGEGSLKITSTAYESIDGHRRYALMTHQFSRIHSLEELIERLDGDRHNSIGMLRKTDMEFETDRLISGRGFSVNEERHYSNFPDIFQAASLLGFGSLLAAVLPEPIASYLAFITGAEGSTSPMLAEYQEQDLVPNIFAFQGQLLDTSPELVERFYDGYREVIAELERLPRQKIVEVGVDSALRIFFPGLTREELPGGAEEFIEKYLIPAFPQPRDLKPEEFDAVADWTLRKGFITAPIDFRQAVSDRFHGS